MTSLPTPPGQGNAKDLEQMGYLGLYQALAGSSDPRVRRHSAYLLGNSGEHGSIPVLIRGLSDPEKGVREQASLALSAIGRIAIGPLTAAMDDPDWKTRYRAAEAIGRIADRQVAAPLIRALGDEHDHVRYMAAKGLTGIRDSAAIGPLIALLTDENEYVRVMAAKGLGALGGPMAGAALGQALAREENDRVKAAITEAMR